MPIKQHFQGLFQTPARNSNGFHSSRHPRASSLETRPPAIASLAGLWLSLLLIVTGGPDLRAAPGDLDPAFDTGNGVINGRTLRVILQPDGKPVIGGLFTMVNGVSRPGFARLNTDGTTDFGFGNVGSGDVTTMARQSDGKFLLAGQSGGMFRVDADGQFDPTFQVSTDGQVLGVRILSTGKIMIGGAFFNVNSTPHNKLARLNSDGTLDTEFTTVTAGIGDYVFEILEQSDGKILVGGEFTNIGGVNRTRIARLEGDGTVDTTFLDGLSGADGVVRSIVTQPDGEILIGGLFGSVNGEVRPGVARLNSDGSLDEGFAANLFGTVNSVVLQADGNILIGGEFQSSGDGGIKFNIARLNADGTRDPSFLDGLFGATKDLSFDGGGSVDTIALQPDGKLVIVGDFTFVNGVGRNHAARLNSDGSLDETFDNGTKGVNGRVWSVAARSDGKVIVGGEFTSVDGQSRNHLARLNADGSLDAGFLDGLSGTANVSGGFGPVRGLVESVAVGSGDKTLIAGFFDRVNGVSRNSVARLNDDGSVDTTFLSANAGVGFGSWASLVTPQRDGKILISGNFSTYDGVSRNGIARLNNDGTLDPTFFDGLSGPNGGVREFVEQEDGKILVGGFFTTFNGATHRGLVRLNSDGSVDTTFMNGLAGLTSTNIFSPDPSVGPIAVQSDGKILIGGLFNTVHGVARDGIARLNSDGSLDQDFLDGLSVPNGGITFIGLLSDGKILFQGGFDTVNGVTRNGIALLNSDGSLDESFFDGQPGVNGGVFSMALQGDGKPLLGGDFSSVNGEMRMGVARLIGDTPAQGPPVINEQPQDQVAVIGDTATFGVTAFGAPPISYQWRKGGTDLPGETKTVLVLPDARLDDAGMYSVRVSNPGGSVDSQAAELTVVPPIPGGVDLSFDPGSGVQAGSLGVMALAEQPDGRVVIGGAFFSVNGVFRNRIARLNADGRLDTTFLDGLSGVGGAGVVASLALQGDGKILIGGSFTNVNGVARRGVARLNNDGSVDPGFLDGLSGPMGGAGIVRLQNDGKILIGGSFTNVNGGARNRIARLNSDGSLDTTFLDGLSGATTSEPGNCFISAVALQGDGKVLIGGVFDFVNGVPLKNLARLNSDGSLDTGFLDGLEGVTSAGFASVNALAVQSDGRVLIGGEFQTVNGVSRSRIARLNSDGSLDTDFLDALAGANVQVLSVVLQPDGKILIGGIFTSVNGESRGNVARLNSDGSLDTEFLDGLPGAARTGGGSSVRALALQSDGKILVGGDFNSFNGIPRNNIVRLHGGAAVTPPIRLEPPSVGSGEVGFSVTGIPGETFDIQRAPSPEGPWNTIGTVEIAQDGTGSFEDTDPPADGAYYRMAQS